MSNVHVIGQVSSNVESRIDVFSDVEEKPSLGEVFAKLESKIESTFSSHVTLKIYDSGGRFPFWDNLVQKLSDLTS